MGPDSVWIVGRSFEPSVDDLRITRADEEAATRQR